MLTQDSTESVAVASPETPAFDSQDVSTWSDAQKQEWNKTGKITAPPKKDAESAAASTSEKKTAVSVPKGKSAAESGAAPKQQEKGKPTADDRIGELTGTIKRLEAELADFRKPKAEPAKAAEAPKELKPPVKPKMADFTGADAYEKYEEAKDKYYEDLVKYESAKAVANDRAERQQAEQQQRFTKLLNDAKARYPDFEEKARPAAKSFLTDETIPVQVKAAVSNNDLALELIYVMSGDPAKFQQFIELARTNPIEAIEEVGVYKRLIREEQAKAKGEPAKGEPTRGEDGKFQKETPVETKPKAPKAPPEVGGRGAATENPAEHAARTGNFSDFDKEMRRKYRAEA